MGKNDTGGATSGHSNVAEIELDMEYMGGSLIFCLFFLCYGHLFLLTFRFEKSFPSKRRERDSYFLQD